MMEPVHVIMGNSEDIHAVSVAWALERVGARVLLWDGIGMHDEAVMAHTISDSGSILRIGEDTVRDVKSLWFRRPVPYQPLADLDPASLKFVDNELRSAHGSLAAALRLRSPLTIGDWHPADASTKGLQLEVALSCGFRIPDTLITNDPVEVADFRTRQSAVLVKHFTPHFWSSDRERKGWQCGPVIIPRDRTLDDAGVRVCPAIYQAVVDKVFDLRVTVIGRRMFTARIVRHDGVSPLDWRPGSVRPGELIMDRYELDERTRAAIGLLMDKLDLRYGCVDLAVDSLGNMFFFEINTGGQFLFIDDYIPEMNLLGEMAGFLLAGSMEYEAVPSSVANLAAFESSDRCAALCSAARRFRQSDRMITRVDTSTPEAA